jgi:hypothetical protein
MVQLGMETNPYIGDIRMACADTHRNHANQRILISGTSKFPIKKAYPFLKR